MRTYWPRVLFYRPSTPGTFGKISGLDPKSNRATAAPEACHPYAARQASV